MKNVNVLIYGFPGKSLCHGGMGWSSVVLIRTENRIALVDTGNFGMRRLLTKHLAERGLKPTDITDLLLTHSHYDHSVNWTLFRHARIVIGETEMQWALNEPWGETPVPELYVLTLDSWKTCVKVKDGEEVFPNITAHLAPGHTPGCLVFHMKTPEHDYIFTGDAAKNRAELVSRDTDMSYDKNISKDSIEMIWQKWREREGTILIAGHDLPMHLVNGEPVYIGKRKAGIKAWFGDDMATTTEFNLY